MQRIRTTASGFHATTAVVTDRLARNVRVRRNLPGEGRLRFDRQLPFLCVYRQPVGISDLGTEDLITTEAAYLFAPASAELHGGLSHLCRELARLMREHFGAFLLLEIWADDTLGARRATGPAFRIVTSEAEALPTTIAAFTAALQEIRLDDELADVRVQPGEPVAPPGLPPLIDVHDPELAGVFVVGLAVRPVYRGAAEHAFYPLVLRSLRRQLSVALRAAVHAFTGMAKEAGRPALETLGPSTMAKATRLVDQHLSEISLSFDFLLQVTPTNSDDAWDEFKQSHFAHAPRFHYRPLPYDPRILKRRLFEAPIERLEDVTLAQLFWEKMDELDRQLTALTNLGTPDFLYSSLQLYGGVDAELLELARTILARVPHRPSPVEENHFDAAMLAQAARDEIDHYHTLLPAFDATVELVSTIASSIMVVHGKLLVSQSASIRPGRVASLLHHEVGTHLLTYFNGRQQRVRQLYAGLAGYEALQEGLAVLAEYLCGGMTPARLRMLAARVVAVQARIDGLPFTEAFHLLHDQHEVSAQVAFVTVLRAYRAGGLTKDAIYLRGLCALLEYLAAGHELEPLYVGKIALAHVPHVQELRRRGIVEPPAILPRVWSLPGVRERIDQCRRLSVLDLVETGT